MTLLAAIFLLRKLVPVGSIFRLCSSNRSVAQSRNYLEVELNTAFSVWEGAEVYHTAAPRAGLSFSSCKCSYKHSLFLPPSCPNKRKQQKGSQDELLWQSPCDKKRRASCSDCSCYEEERYCCEVFPESAVLDNTQETELYFPFPEVLIQKPGTAGGPTLLRKHNPAVLRVAGI